MNEGGSGSNREAGLRGRGGGREQYGKQNYGGGGGVRGAEEEAFSDEVAEAEIEI